MTKSRAPEILVIEDDAAQSTLLVEFLRLLGPPDVGVRTAATLASGLAALEERAAEVIVTDLSLPDSVGTETVTEIRRCAPDVPLVVMSGHGGEDLRAEMAAAGVTDFVLKGHLAYEEVVKRILAAAAGEGEAQT